MLDRPMENCSPVLESIKVGTVERGVRILSADRRLVVFVSGGGGGGDEDMTFIVVEDDGTGVAFFLRW